MKRFLTILIFSLLVMSCGERVVTITEYVGCEVDTECDDGDEMTFDECMVGYCHHTSESVVETPVGCEADTDCEDGDLSTTDTCVELVCHRERVTVVEVPSDFDPSDPARQDSNVMCEMPTACATGNAVTMYGCTSYAGAEPWSERGYLMMFRITGMPLASIHVSPRLWVGDPSDRFFVTIEAGYGLPPVLVREMSVEEIGTGFDIGLRHPDGRDVFSFNISLKPVGDVRSRALQWAMLPGDITDSAGVPLSTCLQTGSFMRMPRHGLLTFQEGLSGEPQCAGETLAVDLDPITFMEGWVREESDPTIRYLYHPPAPGGFVGSFDSMREMIDWARPRYSTHWADADHFCARIQVVRDGVLDSIRPARTVSFRPGVMLMWFDADGTWHFGVADRNFVIRDTGGVRPEGPFGAYTCGTYSSWSGIFLRPCEMMLSADELARFTLVPTDASLLDPAAMYERVSVYEYFR